MNYQQEYYKINKEYLKSKNKEYKENNKEILKEKNKKYKEINRNIIHQQFVCPCGGKYINDGKSRHQKSQRHLKYENKII